MIPPFKDYLQTNIKAFFKEELPDFELRCNKGEIVCFKKEPHLLVAIHVVFIVDKDRVIPGVSWSKHGKLAKETTIAKFERYRGFSDNRDCIDSFEEAYLFATEFGYYSSGLEVGQDEPSSVRLKEIFSSVAATDILQDMEIEDWESETFYHNWGMIDCLFPNVIQTSDCEYAVGNIVTELKSLVTEHYLPYLNDQLQKFRKDSQAKAGNTS